MRVGLMVAAIAAMVSAAPVSAATIVQTDDEGTMRGFEGFDSRRGQLNKVTLGVSINKSRSWLLEAAAPDGTVRRVDYSVNGIWTLSGSYLGTAAALNVPLIGAGTSLVTLSTGFGGVASGLFAVAVAGAATVDLDPLSFINQRRFFDGNDTGFYDPTGSDTTLTATGTNRFIRNAGFCTDFTRTGEDFCGTVRYQLTYDYTPAAVDGAVPEPATWAMMLLGFGGIGAALRRRKRLVTCPSC